MRVCVYVFYNKSVIFLGKGEKIKYDRQRVWGGIGFGVAAFLTGFTVDIWSEGKIYKTYTSAFLFVFIFTCIDLICCRKLKVISSLI